MNVLPLLLSLAGKTIHKIHHETPYFHVSLDPPELIIGVMALAAVVFLVLFQAGPLSFTATIAYYTAGEPGTQTAHMANALCQ